MNEARLESWRSAQRSLAHIAGVLAVLALSTQLNACSSQDQGEPGEDVPIGETGEAADEIMSAGMERLIPLRVSLLEGCNPGPSCPMISSYENIQQSVRYANQVFRPAGVQVYVETVTRYNVPTIVDKIEEHEGGDPDEPRVKVPFSSIKSDLKQLHPNMPLNAWSESSERAVRTWLHHVNAIYEKTRDLHVWIHTEGDGYSNADRPESGRGIRMQASHVDDRRTFAHELGHFLGLEHTFSGNDGGVDPETLLPRKKSDRWDLMYKPGSSASDPHKYYSSRAAAAVDEADLEVIDKNGNCPPSGGGAITCTIEGNGGYSETRSTGDSALKGLGFTFASGDLATNIMTYAEATSSGEESISTSQAQVIRKYLRWEVPFSDNAKANILEGFTLPIYTGALSSKRTRLGQPVAAEPLEKLDFDGDGRRDIGYWEPPKTLSGSGTFTALLSSESFSTAAGNIMSLQFGGVGDIPIPGDWNGDGRTDFAVFQPGGGINRNDPTSTTAYWRSCPTASTATSTSCAAPPAPIAWGTRSDTPQLGMEMDGAAGNEMSFYRPSTGTWYYRNVAATFSGSKAIGTDDANVVTMPGLYDCDLLSDLAIYEPGTATFKLLRSESSWSTASITTHTLDSGFIPHGAPGDASDFRDTALVMAGATRKVMCPAGQFVVNRKRRTFSLFTPADGTWHTLWNPLGASSSVQSCAYGDGARDQPLPGLDANDDMTSDFGLFRPSLTEGSAGTLFTRVGSSSSCSGAAASVSASGMGTKHRLFAVNDMTGDGKMDLLALDWDGTLSWLTSESAYASSGGSTPIDPDAVVF
jgi:hypothetical protein